MNKALLTSTAFALALGITGTALAASGIDCNGNKPGYYVSMAATTEPGAAAVVAMAAAMGERGVPLFDPNGQILTDDHKGAGHDIKSAMQGCTTPADNQGPD